MSIAHKCENCGKYFEDRSLIHDRPNGEVVLDKCTAKFEIIGGTGSWNGGDLCDKCYAEALRKFVDMHIAKKEFAPEGE